MFLIRVLSSISMAAVARLDRLRRAALQSRRSNTPLPPKPGLQSRYERHNKMLVSITTTIDFEVSEQSPSASNARNVFTMAIILTYFVVKVMKLISGGIPIQCNVNDSPLKY